MRALIVSNLVLGSWLAQSAIPVTASTVPWQELNETVNGRLMRGTPFARDCFLAVAPDVGGAFNSSACSTTISHYIDHVALSNDLGAYMNTQWETCQRTASGCLLNSEAPFDPTAFTPPRVCHQGSVPDYGIAILTVGDVRAAFNFTKAHGVPLVIKNSGHDYKGRSGAPGALALWTHGLQSIIFARDFIPVGCPYNREAVEGVTFGAGVNYGSLVDFADANNLTIPSGGDATVGAAGGYLQGGGHSILSNAHGLAVDRVLQFELVAPNGDHVFANECQNEDLFFALRGGGGGTFGIVLNVTTLALPQMPITTVLAQFDPTPDKVTNFVNFSTNVALELAEEGWGTYNIPAAGVAILANTLLNETRADETVSSMRKFITEEMNGNFSFTVEPAYRSFFNNFVAPYVNVPVGIPLTPVSRLVPAANFRTADGRKAISAAVNTIIGQTPISFMFGTTPFQYGDRGGTSVTPAWRSSVWHVAAAGTWNFNTTASGITDVYRGLRNAIKPLRELTQSSGAYQNEADVYEPDFEDSFWGKNYDRLLSIKRKYDPDHILDCWQCVGWKGADDPKYKCYIPEAGVE